jgi:ABC-2 type transport system ATP-binding protein
MNPKITRIKLENISKKFDKNNKNKSALAKLLDALKRNKNKKEIQVLKNISLEAKAGENIGIIGKNGSGKSTLLRIIAKIYLSDKGTLETNGQLIYLTGFGHGLKPKLTMKENIFLSGSILGLSQEAIKERFNEIVEFSELEEYLDTKLFKFSSGMQTRLASAIGMHCITHKNPDILLIDEVMGGGADKNFKEKSLKKMEELLKGGATVILVSHELEAIKKYCDKVIWLEKGEIKIQGNPEEITTAYKDSN